MIALNTDWLQGRARISANSQAVMDAETKESWTYRELNLRATNLANYLYQNGVKKSDRVALIAPNDICYLDFLFACAKIGAIFVPINWRLSADEIKYILEDCDPAIIAVTTHKEFLINNVNVKRKILADSANYIEIVNNNYKEQTTFDLVEDNDNLAIIYTSGTTGRPKGVVITHKMALCNGINTVLSWNLKSSDATVTANPMFHTAGLFALTIPLLMIGGRVIIQKKFDADETIQLIENEKCTHMFLVPTMYYMLTQSKYFKQAKFSTMQSFISGGAPCSYSIYKAFFEKNLPFKESYGLTEAGPNNFFIHPSKVKAKKGSVGKPIIFSNVKILNEDGNEVEIGQVGELVITGDHVFKHYWNKKEETDRVLKNGQLYTGDLATKDRDGYFYMVGRKKDMIISGGENIFPSEVENVLNEHPAVGVSIVVGIPDVKWGEIVTAMITLVPHEAISEEELKHYCCKKLGRYKVPRNIIIVDHLPVTGVGKIDKKKIIQMCSQSVLAI